MSPRHAIPGRLSEDSPGQRLGRWQATALAISFVVGSGILVLPTFALDLAGPQGSLAAWVAMTVLAVPLIAMFVILGKKHFRAGGIVEYSIEAMGKRFAIGVHLSMTTALFLGMPAMIYVTAIYCSQVFGLRESWLPVLSHSILLLLCLNHLRSVRKSTKISIVTTVLLLFVAFCAIGSNPGAMTVGASSLLENWTFSTSSFWNASVLVFFGFVGWESMSICIRDLKEPAKDASFVYWGSFWAVTLVYLALASTVSGYALTGHKIGGADGILRLLSRSSLLIPLRVLMIVVLIANLNAWVLAGYRQIQFFESAVRSLFPDNGPFGKMGRKSLLMVYFVSISFLLIGLDSGKISPAEYFKFSSQNWIVMYAGILLFFFKKGASYGERVIGILAAMSFLILISSLSWVVLISGAYFALSVVGYYFRFKTLSKEVDGIPVAYIEVMESQSKVSLQCLGLHSD